MALARFGSFMTPTLPAGFSASLAYLVNANKPSLDRYKAVNGPGPVGVRIELDNGTVGHFNPDGNFQFDYVPPEITAGAQDAARRADAGLPPAPPPPSNVAPFVPPGPYVPGTTIPQRDPSLPPPLAYGAQNPAPASSAKILGLPPLAIAGIAGVALFLVARRL